MKKKGWMKKKTNTKKDASEKNICQDGTFMMEL